MLALLRINGQLVEGEKQLTVDELIPELLAEETISPNRIPSPSTGSSTASPYYYISIPSILICLSSPLVRSPSRSRNNLPDGTKLFVASTPLLAIRLLLHFAGVLRFLNEAIQCGLRVYLAELIASGAAAPKHKFEQKLGLEFSPVPPHRSVIPLHTRFPRDSLPVLLPCPRSLLAIAPPLPPAPCSPLARPLPVRRSPARCSAPVPLPPRLAPLAARLAPLAR
ncbi:hypothetical protein KSP39_PZI001189 [Platanthera zijinensis]|uniref:Uncharacterized protein n=1 Tax=Platanthera zijinensis TaxID=2320716 RepID=A0AAP0GFI2_9ASPA